MITMIRKFLVAIAVFAASPAFVFSQDIFFLLDQGGGATGTAETTDGSGSISIYSTFGFDFDAIDFDFTISDSSVIQITGGELFNPLYAGDFAMRRFATESSLDSVTTTSVRVFAISFSVFTNSTGLRSSLAEYDLGFDPTVGSDGAFLLGRVDFDIVGEGTVTLGLEAGRPDPFAILLPDLVLNPVFGSATLTVASGVPTLGDLNSDGDVSFNDIPQFVEVLRTGEYKTAADCNQDDAVNFSDIPPFVDILLGN